MTTTTDTIERFTVQDYAKRLGLQFSSADMERAFHDWGCNCGPSALAVVLGITLDAARDLIVDFPSRKYTSPTMMGAALASFGATYGEISKCRKVPATLCPDVLPDHGLVRVQWTGPWTEPGVNPKWAYRVTHWFATFMLEPRCPEHRVIFDVNSGPSTWEHWLSTIPKAITDSIPRADGGWYLTHLWEVTK